MAHEFTIQSPTEMAVLAAQLKTPGAIIVSPTDTVWGLGMCSRFTAMPSVLTRINGLKQSQKTQLIMLIASPIDAREFCDIDDKQENILQAHWPGAITFILKTKPKFKDQWGDTLAVRNPKDAFLSTLLATLDSALWSTSANLHLEKTPSTFEQVRELFKPQLATHDVILNWPFTPKATPSTLVDLSKQNPIVIRQGEVIFHC